MPNELGQINAVRDMIASIKVQVQTYRQCKQQSGLTNDTLDSLDQFLQQLEAKKVELEG